MLGQVEQETLARELINSRAGWPELSTGLAQLDDGRIDHARVGRIADAMRSAGGWGALPPVTAHLGRLTAADVAEAAEGRWTRDPTLEDVGALYLRLVGGCKHRSLAACQAGVPIRFRLAFARSTRALDDSALLRTVRGGG